VLRFRRAAALLRRADSGTISDVAAACGYADHAHLTREFGELAGCTPSDYRAGR
jgi:AraC-like DNA-binding protein